MKNINQQYIDLKEGKISTTQFLRNARLMHPNYITNVTSFNDAVKILKNKSVIFEAKEEKYAINPDMVNPFELKKGIDKEMEKCDDYEKAKKKALSNLAKCSNYYTKLLAGESTRQHKTPKQGDVDTQNGMKKVKTIKEIYILMEQDLAPNSTVKQASQFIHSNPTLKDLSGDISLQSSGNDAILKYMYWEPLPHEALSKLELQFNVQEEEDHDEDTGGMVSYMLKLKDGVADKKDLGKSFSKFTTNHAHELNERELKLKESIKSIVREIISEYELDEQGGDNPPSKDFIIDAAVSKVGEYLADEAGGEMTVPKSIVDQILQDLENQYAHQYGDEIFQDILRALEDNGIEVQI
jgi:hypothetical protein